VVSVDLFARLDLLDYIIAKRRGKKVLLPSSLHELEKFLLVKEREKSTTPRGDNVFTESREITMARGWLEVASLSLAFSWLSVGK